VVAAILLPLAVLAAFAGRAELAHRTGAGLFRQAHAQPAAPAPTAALVAGASNLAGSVVAPTLPVAAPEPAVSASPAPVVKAAPTRRRPVRRKPVSPDPDETAIRTP
jgi:hypothetical protein